MYLYIYFLSAFGQHLAVLKAYSSLFAQEFLPMMIGGVYLVLGVELKLALCKVLYYLSSLKMTFKYVSYKNDHIVP